MYVMLPHIIFYKKWRTESRSVVFSYFYFAHCISSTIAIEASRTDMTNPGFSEYDIDCLCTQ